MMNGMWLRGVCLTINEKREHTVSKEIWLEKKSRLKGTYVKIMFI